MITQYRVFNHLKSEAKVVKVSDVGIKISFSSDVSSLSDMRALVCAHFSNCRRHRRSWCIIFTKVKKKEKVNHENSFADSKVHALGQNVLFIDR